MTGNGSLCIGRCADNGQRRPGDQLQRQAESLAAKDDAAKRLMSIPGIGPLGASAIIAAVGDGRQFKKARDLSAWLGIVSRQCSTGGKPTLLGISNSPECRFLLFAFYGGRPNYNWRPGRGREQYPQPFQPSHCS